MSTDNPQEHQDNPGDQKKCSFPSEISLKYDHEPFNNIHQSIDRQARAQESANVNAANIPSRQSQEQRNANKIAMISIWVNSVLTLITAGVFACTAISLWFTRRDVKDAQKQFEISNRPFIAIGTVVVDSIEEGQKPNIRFYFYNSGKFPAKIVSFTYVKGSGSSNTTDDDIRAVLKTGTPKDGKLSNMILSSFPIVLPGNITDVFPITKPRSDSLKQATRIFFLYIEVKYKNFLTDSSYVKKETYKIAAGNPALVSLIDATEGTF
jgi:hypothetical protein